MDKIAIVVGICGMDGEAAGYFLLEKGYKVIGTYRKNSFIDLESVKEKYNSPNFSLEHCEITDFNSVKVLLNTCLEKHGKIDEIYLLAAQSQVGISFDASETTVLTNGMSAYNFLESLRLLTPKTKLYFAATSELLGGDPAKCPFDENSDYECRSPYAIGKELGTRFVKYYRQTYGIFACYGILFNHSNNSRGLSFFSRRITQAAARISLGKQKELELGTLDFWRDEHWADFGVEMMWKMLQQEDPETFVICNGLAIHGEQFLDEAFNYFNLNWRDYVKIDSSRFRPNEVIKLVGNPQKAINKLGWLPNRISIKTHMGLMCKHDYELESGNKPKRPEVFKLFPR